MRPADWNELQRERGRLIDLHLRGCASPAETARLEILNRQADEHLDEVAPRDCSWLEKLERLAGGAK